MGITHEERRLKLQAHPQERGYRVRVFKWPSKSIPTYVPVAIFEGATYDHLAAPELWCGKLAGGGTYRIEICLGGTWKTPPGLEGDNMMRVDLVGPATDPDWAVVARPEWQGPANMLWPLEHEATERTNTRDALAAGLPPSPGITVPASSTLPPLPADASQADRERHRLEAAANAARAEQARLAEEGKRLDLDRAGLKHAADRQELIKAHSDATRALENKLASLEAKIQALASRPEPVSALAGIGQFVPLLTSWLDKQAERDHREQDRREKRDGDERAERTRQEERRETREREDRDRREKYEREERERRDKAEAERAQRERDDRAQARAEAEARAKREQDMVAKLAEAQGPAKQFEGMTAMTEALGKVATMAANLAVVNADIKQPGAAEPSALDAIAVISENVAKVLVSMGQRAQQPGTSPPAGQQQRQLPQGPQQQAQPEQQQGQDQAPEEPPRPELLAVANLIEQWAAPSEVAKAFFQTVDASVKGDKWLAAQVQAAKSTEDLISIYAPVLAPWYAGASAKHAADAKNDDPNAYLEEVETALTQEDARRRLAFEAVQKQADVANAALAAQNAAIHAAKTPLTVVASPASPASA